MTVLLFCLFSQILFLSRCYAQTSPNWPGWNEIQNLFVFGDSYTQTGFNASDEQPSPENPLGNPTFPGRTSSNGRNWINFLTVKYNSSKLLTYNFAVSGAVVDDAIFPSRTPSMRVQIEDRFLPEYGNESHPWDSSNSLFAAFFGINDINASYRSRNSSINSLIISSYSSFIEDLYQTGARNFLFLNVPAVHRSPLTMNSNESSTIVELQRKAITDFNLKIRNMATSLVERHKDATAFVFDTFTLFNEVLDDPSSHDETAVYRNTTDFCQAYASFANRNYDEDYSNSSCSNPQREFFWLDQLHPTPPIHDALAEEVASQLRRNQAVGAKDGPALFTGAASRVSSRGWSSWVPYAVMSVYVLWALMDWK